MMSQDIEVQETMHKCIVGGTITAGGAFAGGLVGGPKGMAVGGAGGSILAALIMKGNSRNKILSFHLLIQFRYFIHSVPPTLFNH